MNLNYERDIDYVSKFHTKIIPFDDSVKSFFTLDAYSDKQIKLIIKEKLLGVRPNARYK